MPPPIRRIVLPLSAPYVRTYVRPYIRTYARTYVRPNWVLREITWPINDTNPWPTKIVYQLTVNVIAQTNNITYVLFHW